MYVPSHVDIIDVFSPSNLNMQILANVHTIGRRKTEVAIERVKAISIFRLSNDVACFVLQDN